MKEIKVIDLLNMIANGEKIPLKIKVKGYEYRKSNGQFWCDEIETYLIDNCTSIYQLNDEVEIIEEDNSKIKKICTFPGLEDDDYAYEDGDRPNNVLIHNPIEQLFINKINEIIDKINNMED